MNSEMLGGPNSERHLSFASFIDYANRGMPFLLPLQGEPPVALFVTEAGESIGLQFRGEASSRLYELAALQVTTGAGEDGSSTVRIICSDAGLFEPFYRLACSIADAIQLDGLAPEAAAASRLREWRQLLRTTTGLQERIVVGLLGELWVLDCLRCAVGPDAALAAWRGPSAEEHDFGLPEVDIEVKTTLKERRDHRIASLGQLMSTGDRPLYIVSVQLTAAGDGGTSLRDRVGEFRSLLAAHSMASLEALEERLINVGYAEDAREPATRYRLRSEPTLVRVETPVPALTLPRLTGLLESDAASRLVDVEYDINLDGLGENVLVGEIEQLHAERGRMFKWT